MSQNRRGSRNNHPNLRKPPSKEVQKDFQPESQNNAPEDNKIAALKAKLKNKVVNSQTNETINNPQLLSSVNTNKTGTTMETLSSKSPLKADLVLLKLEALKKKPEGLSIEDLKGQVNLSTKQEISSTQPQNLSSGSEDFSGALAVRGITSNPPKKHVITGLNPNKKPPIPTKSDSTSPQPSMTLAKAKLSPKGDMNKDESQNTDLVSEKRTDLNVENTSQPKIEDKNQTSLAEKEIEKLCQENFPKHVETNLIEEKAIKKMNEIEGADMISQNDVDNDTSLKSNTLNTNEKIQKEMKEVETNQNQEIETNFEDNKEKEMEEEDEENNDAEDAEEDFEKLSTNSKKLKTPSEAIPTSSITIIKSPIEESSASSKLKKKLIQKETEKIKKSVLELENIVKNIENKMPKKVQNVVSYAQSLNRKRPFNQRFAKVLDFFEKFQPSEY